MARYIDADKFIENALKANIDFAYPNDDMTKTVLSEALAVQPTVDMPEAHTVEEAYRAVIPNISQRPLEFTEIDDEPFVWIEYNADMVHTSGYYLEPASVFRENNAEAHVERIGSDISYYVRADTYNKLWRCWATKPTDEERKAAKWE